MKTRAELIAAVRHWSSRREAWLILLIIVALGCFGSYYRHWIAFRDEGGTVTLVAKRLLEGERPLRDVALGYNVLWYYPVVALFKVFGVNFVLLRVYCFALSTLTAVLGFLTVERVSRRPWLAFLVGVMLVLVPGMTFKNYMPLLAVVNVWCLVHFVLRKRQPDDTAVSETIAQNDPIRWGWLAFSAVVLGASLLVRIDVGMFFTVLWLGAIILRALTPGLRLGARWGLLVGGPALLFTTVLAVHLPVYIDAKRRDFDRPFIRQYAAWPQEIIQAVYQRFGRGSNAIPNVSAVETVESVAAPVTPEARAERKAAKSSQNREVLRRKTWRDFLSADKDGERWLVLLLYAPLLSLVPLAVWALYRMWRSWSAGESAQFRRATAALLVVGGALTVFPQYFFFRPDSPHLSEFSPGFWTGVLAALILLASSSEKRRWPMLAKVLGVLLVAHAAIFLWRMFPDRWAGTMAARWGRSRFLDAANGVDVYLNKREWENTTGLLQVIDAHSKPGEYLVAYPYHPTINVAADRPTYEKNVYVDNATRTRHWEDEAIARFEKFKPAIIAISEWAINGTDASRFSIWAAKTKTWVQTNYVYQGTYGEVEIYTRPTETTVMSKNE
ncbi:hypothetical protein ACXR0O_05825 [Verrucomicrobiota bacterium sgz303538]